MGQSGAYNTIFLGARRVGDNRADKRRGTGADDCQ